jgi:hypothetical protein
MPVIRPPVTVTSGSVCAQPTATVAHRSPNAMRTRIQSSDRQGCGYRNCEYRQVRRDCWLPTPKTVGKRNYRIEGEFAVWLFSRFPRTCQSPTWPRAESTSWRDPKNRRPVAPSSSALPGCATLRPHILTTDRSRCPRLPNDDQSPTSRKRSWPFGEGRRNTNVSFHSVVRRSLWVAPLDCCGSCRSSSCPFHRNRRNRRDDLRISRTRIALQWI